MKNIINIINFVRDVEPRPGREALDLVEPVQQQICLLREHHLRGTFLLQYDALIDATYVSLMKGCQDICEIGLWLEIVQPLVEKIGQTWNGRYPWDWHNDVGFLIGYTPEVRIQLLDEAMHRFYETFGYYPSSVGAWHLDAVSLAHLEKTYHIKACCICREQVGMDGYTLDGGYYNQAYYPSKRNIFCPAQTKEMQISVPVFRMLGSDPIHAYDYRVKPYGAFRQYAPTLEPIMAGRSAMFCDWFFQEVFDGNGMSFQYAQVGQENSFGWDKMKDGITYQYASVKKLRDAGKVEVMTLGESGAWYQQTFQETPPSSYTAFHDYLAADRKAVWYENKQYRIGLLWEEGVVYIRDWYLFEEQYPEKYLEKRCETHPCEFRNLPIMDSVLFTDKTSEKTAGIYLTVGEEAVRWNTFSYEENEKTAVIELTNDTYHAKITLQEEGVFVSCDKEALTLCFVYDEAAACGKKVQEKETFSNIDSVVLTFPDHIQADGAIRRYKFDGVSYGIIQRKEVCEQGYCTSLRKMVE